MQADAVHWRQFAAHATQLDPDNLYPVEQTEQDVTAPDVLQVEQPKGQDIQFPRFPFVEFWYPVVQVVQNVLSVHVEQLGSQAIQVPSFKKYPLVHPWQYPLLLTEVHPGILTHCPPNKKVLDRAGQLEHTKVVYTIW